MKRWPRRSNSRRTPSNWSAGRYGRRRCRYRDRPNRDGPSGCRHRTRSPCGYGRWHGCPVKLAQTILPGHHAGVAEILDQLERMADATGSPCLRHPRYSRRASSCRHHNGCGSDRRIRLHPRGSMIVTPRLFMPLLDLRSPPLDLVMDVEALLRVLLLGDLEAHDIFIAPRRCHKGHSRWNPGRDASATAASRSFPGRYSPSPSRWISPAIPHIGRAPSMAHGRQSR